jgi:hypothetical protein
VFITPGRVCSLLSLIVTGSASVVGIIVYSINVFGNLLSNYSDIHRNQKQLG